MTTARAIARTDVFCSLGDVASRNGYVRPELNDGNAIDIRQGRHPVVEQMLPSGAFVPNDTRLSSLEEQLTEAQLQQLVKTEQGQSIANLMAIVQTLKPGSPERKREFG